MPTASPATTAALQKRIWDGSLPLEIRLAARDCTSYDTSDPYLISLPRLSYLSPLLPRLHAFFQPVLINPEIASHDAWISFEELPLKWHYPLGLLYDLFSGALPAGLDDASVDRAQQEASVQDISDSVDDKLPWKMTLHYSSYPAELIFPLDSEGHVLRDAFVNAVKEADFVRNGTAKAAMSLSKQDASALWRAVLEHDLPLFNSVNTKLLNPPGIPLRNVPIKIYLPINVQAPDAPEPIKEENEEQDDQQRQQQQPHHAGSVRVVQGLVPPVSAAKQPTTLGGALNTLLPTVFPSRRNPVLACPVLHGAVVPMASSLEELGRAASYVDGFLHIVVVLLS
ncbi:putative autophagy protein Apg5 [Myriangium duriaei CBS 260.36]|uniref:Autophagy protein 5 n=1 Tax=Myriangium duriaei CBS 260.36 TaxID=1168546 RepID=A0A9P4MKY9_9PEZI|nr:putative autophagy protein Apg5 [Myriangium duriaei CBS 260.36]